MDTSGSKDDMKARMNFVLDKEYAKGPMWWLDTVPIGPAHTRRAAADQGLNVPDSVTPSELKNMINAHINEQVAARTSALM